MSIKSFLFLKYAQWKVKQEYKTHSKAMQMQEKFLNSWINKNQETIIGKEHNFQNIRSIKDYQKQVPIRNYEDYIPYIERLKSGQFNILSSEAPCYLLMTSGTTAGSKYIPISEKGIRHQIDAAMKVLCFYAAQKNSAEFMNYKMIFLQGSPELDNKFNIPSGRLSGVVYHHVPKFFQRNKLPSYAINVIPDWQEKLAKIVEETKHEDISILGGIPPWCIQYFEQLLVRSGKNQLKDLFPHLEIYIHGGLDFSNYKEHTERLLGNGVSCLQTFPASEGFFAVQDCLDTDDMLLLLNQGIFYEFKPFNNNIQTDAIAINEVELGKRYELIITNNSGFYRYAIGDLIEFTSLEPYRIRVVGRTSQFISAFGEHVIAYEIEKTMEKAKTHFELNIEDYFVSPNIADKRYEWRIELPNDTDNEKLRNIAVFLDAELAILNKYYDHLIQGNIINNCKIIPIEMGTFKRFREDMGKEGGQNKVVRLANTNKMAFDLIDNQLKKRQ